MLPCLTIFRLGSTTQGALPYKVEINPVQAIKNSSSKLLMKRCFSKAGVKTAEWWTSNGKVFFPCGNDKTPNAGINDLPFPIVSKSHYGSRGMGNTLHKDPDSLKSWLAGKDLSNYIFEAYKSYFLEFRLHVAKGIGCFYACRKALKKDTPKDKAWQRHDDNCSWFIESNPDFQKPNSWADIEKDCLKAIQEVGLDVGAFDIRVQTPKDKDGKKRSYQDYVLIEVNSAPSFAEGTLEKYTEIVPKIVNLKLSK